MIPLNKLFIEQKLQQGYLKLSELLTINMIDKNIVNNIDSKIMYVDNMIPIVYCKSIIQCSPEALFDYLVHDISNTCHEWNDLMYHSSTLHEFKTDTNIIARISTIISNGSPVCDREDVFMHICDKTQDKKSYFELSFGIDENTIPLNISNKAINPNKLVRSDMHFAAKKITFNENGCEYITIWHYDPMGWLSKILPRKILGNIILKNLVHEHEKIINKYSTIKYSAIKYSTYSFINSILTSFINIKMILLVILLLILLAMYFYIINLFPLTGIYDNII